VAVYLGVTRKTVYQWIEEGRLDAVRVAGRLIRIPREGIQDLKDPEES